MDPQQKPRFEPRLVFALVMVSIPVILLIGRVILVRAGDECDPDGVGSIAQMFVAGVGCEQPVQRPPGR